MKHLITEYYIDKDRGCELIEGELVEVFSNKGIGSIGVRRKDESEVWIAGFSGHILHKISVIEHDNYLNSILAQMEELQRRVRRGVGLTGANWKYYNTYLQLTQYYYKKKSDYWGRFEELTEF